jgi:integrase
MRRSFGSIARLPSKRYRAPYTGPDARWHNAPTTYLAKIDAEGWLAAERRLIESGGWTAPAERTAAAARAEQARKASTFARYADAWLAARGHLEPHTLVSYQTSIDKHLKPAFADLPISAITPAQVRAWFDAYGTRTPTARAHAYQVLTGIFRQALDDELITRSPCRVRGASTAKTAREPQALSLAELLTLVAAMPPQHQALTLLCGLCGLRFGEATGLRRRDVDLAGQLIHVQRAAIRLKGSKRLSRPKTPAAVRTIAMPAAAATLIAQHLDTLPTNTGRDSLVFPGRDGKPLAASSVYGRKARTEHRRTSASEAGGTGRGVRVVEKKAYGFYAAREAIGRPDLHWHDLRRTAATIGAQSGATVREMQHRLGHTTPTIALHYQAATTERDRTIATNIQNHIDTLTTGT